MSQTQEKISQTQEKIENKNFLEKIAFKKIFKKFIPKNFFKKSFSTATQKTDKLAKFLNIPECLLTRWIAQGKIPVYYSKVSDRCFFNEKILKDWIASHQVHSSNVEIDFEENKETKVSCETKNFLSSLEKAEVFYNVKGSNKEEILKNVISQIADFSQEEKDVLLENVLKREECLSTGMGKGIAIPHPQINLPHIVKESKIFSAFLENQTDFNSPDGEPVFFLFLLFSSDPQSHLLLLSKICYCIKDSSFIDFLKSKPEKEALYQKIKDLL